MRSIKFLIDTNIFIAAEDYSALGESTLFGAHASELLKLLNQLGFSACLSSATAKDIENDKDMVRKSKSRRALKKYNILPEHAVDATVLQIFKNRSRTQDSQDEQIVATFYSGSVDFLVSNDNGLRRHAKEAAEDPSRVMSLEEALEYLRAMSGTPSNYAECEQVKASVVDLSSEFFDSLRDDYKEFNSWWRGKVAAEDRVGFLIGPKESPEALAVLKPQNEGSDYFKICTFKVGEDHSGLRLGELLLYSIVDFARKNKAKELRVTVLPKHEGTILFLRSFGFEKIASKGAEIVFSKQLYPPITSPEKNYLRFNILHGPGQVDFQKAYVIPVKNSWHNELFPLAPGPTALFSAMSPPSNAIRKAYVCKSPTRTIEPGDAIFFYRSHSKGHGGITCLGVVEDTLVSTSHAEIIKFVSRRTVFAHKELKALEGKSSLVILFRFDRPLDRVIPLEEMMLNGFKSAPQSITQLDGDKIKWLKGKI